MSNAGSTPERSTAHFSNVDVADLLAEVGDILQILDANRFRVIAFQNAAEAVRNLPQDINLVYADGAEGALQQIHGIGKGIAGVIGELLTAGQVAEFEELRTQVPPGVVAMIHVPDVGPKTARRLWLELGITSVDELQAAATEGKIREIKGFGAKKEQNILRGIELMARRGDERMPIGTARPLALSVMVALAHAVPPGAIQRMEAAGSLRRWRETIGDLDILVVSQEPQPVMAAFCSLPQVSDVVGSGETKSSVILTNGLRADLRVVEARHWGAALQYFTGSKEHNVGLRELALKQGWSLNEYGLTATGDGDGGQAEQRFFAEEAELYGFLALDWVPPELRENRGELQAARQHALPRLIELGDIQGELHGHSTWSDGTASIAGMAEAAQRCGYRFWAVCDHSVGLGMVNGLDAGRLAQQAEEIAALNRRWEEQGVDFRLLRGSEVEILADGSLGLPDEVLAQLDVVVASIHSSLRQDRAVITARCLRAVRNPYVHILGHPTGRLIGQRPPSDIDLEQVLQACAETGTVVEINAHPSRLDVNDIYARRAVELGCRIAINSDAHELDGMAIMEYGIATARRAWLTSEHVINTRPWDLVRTLLKGKS